VRYTDEHRVNSLKKKLFYTIRARNATVLLVASSCECNDIASFSGSPFAACLHGMYASSTYCTRCT